MIHRGENIRRFLFAGLGIFFVALGAIGIWLPVIPTVGPLILASVCFAKSFPWLEERLVRHPIFARFHHYLDGTEEMSVKTRISSIVMMWLSITISGTVLWFSGRAHVWLLVLLGVLGLIGTVVISRFGRKKRQPGA